VISRNYINIALIVMAITMVGSVDVTLNNFISVSMEKSGFSSFQIGIIHTARFSSGLLTGFLLPVIIARFGLARTFMAAALITAVNINVYKHTTTIAEMVPLRFLLGFCFGSFYAVVESWINGIAEEKNRSKIASVYCTILVGGFSFGSHLINVIPNTAEAVYAFCTAGFVMSCIPVLLARKSAPSTRMHARYNPFKALTIVPVVMAVTAFYGLVENALLSMLTVYGLKAGLSKEASVNMYTAFNLGGMAMLIPFGIIADKVPRQKMLLALLGLSFAVSCMLHFVIPDCNNHSGGQYGAERLVNEESADIKASPYLLYTILFAWGGVMLAIYPVLMSILGQQARGEQLSQATTGMVMVYGIGSTFAPVTIGKMMDVLGAAGFPIGASVFLLMATLVAGYFCMKERKLQCSSNSNSF